MKKYNRENACRMSEKSSGEKCQKDQYQFKRILFIGSKESGLKVLKKIYALSGEVLVGCVTVDDAEDVRSDLDDFRIFCKKHDIDLDVLCGKCDLTDSVKKFMPDICFVMGWYYIISEEVLSSLPGGFIGIHNSLLPRHRGFAPVVWSMIAGEKKTGFSVFSFDRGMDTGDVWYQKEVEIEEKDYVSDVLKKIDMEIEKFFDDCFLNILNGTLKPQKQRELNVSYGARRTAEDGRINWEKTAQEIYNFIRAQSKPYPGAYAFYNEQKIKIWRAEVFQYRIQGTPGQIGIINHDDGMAVVVCGEDTGLVLHEIEASETERPILDVVKGLEKRME